MKDDLHKRIEETLNSLDGLQRAEANPYLYGKVKSRLEAGREVVPAALAWRLVTALVVVAIVNVFTLRHFQAEKTDKGAALVATEYSISLPQTYYDEQAN